LSLSLLCSIAANLLVNYAVGKMSVFKVASLGAVSTLCTVIGGLLLKEPFTVELVIGAVLIIVGIWQITRPAPQPKEEVAK
jgi:drug/metabolite transporter (DMT)-like permease